MSRQRKARSRKRDSDRIFQYQSFWLSTRADTDAYYINWYDPKTGRTQRRTTGTQDLDEAKQQLIDAAQATPPDDPQDPTAVDIAAVKQFYFEHHVNESVRDKAGPARAFAYLLEYLTSVGAQCKVADITLARQVGFMIWCRDKRGLSNKTISTYLSYIKAGLRFCSRPHLIKDARREEREVQILRDPPHIDDSEEGVTKHTKLPKSAPRSWVPSDAQLAAMFDIMGEGQDHEAMFRYMLMALNTWARPEAITELSVLQQVDFNGGIVDLNPAGRVQNKKVRPRIRLTDNLRGWLLHWNLDRPIVYYGRPVGRIDNRTLKKLAQCAGVDPTRVNRYMLRHYMATRIRRVPGIVVEREERAAWMGHLDPKHKTTEAWYETFDPDYLQAAMRATDAIMADLNRLTRRRSLIAPAVVNATWQRSVIQGSKSGTSGT